MSGYKCLWDFMCIRQRGRERERQTDRHQKGWERESGFSNRVPALPALLRAEKTDKSSLHHERVVLCSFQWTLDIWICEVKHIDNNVILLHEHVGIDSKGRLLLCAWERRTYKWINGSNKHQENVTKYLRLGINKNNRIQNKRFRLHNICVCVVYIYFVYINKHT